MLRPSPPLGASATKVTKLSLDRAHNQTSSNPLWRLHPRAGGGVASRTMSAYDLGGMHESHDLSEFSMGMSMPMWEPARPAPSTKVCCLVAKCGGLRVSPLLWGCSPGCCCGSCTCTLLPRL